ncbi:hypothetical protein BDW22DRAFT_781288 [Trametopsis cervina]|nr:hypothetical protein BDW22DRAFT_781288 [Trametopsis cervina]
MTIPYIPNEIIHIILLQVDDSGWKDCLASCTLVCKRWLPLARGPLFCSISLQVGHSREVQFCETARQTPSIAQSVRDLFLSAAGPVSSVPLSNLREILCVLPRLRSLHIWLFPITQDDYFTAKTTHSLAKLTILLPIRENENIWISFLQSFLPLFSHIGLFELLYQQVPGYPALTPDPQYLLSQAHAAREFEPSEQITHASRPPSPIISGFYWGRYRMNGQNDFPLAQQHWLSDYLSPVRYLSLDYNGNFDSGHNEFFSRISPGVEFLQLRLAVFDATMRHLPAFIRDVLSTCTRLRSFTLILGTYFTDEETGVAVADALLRSLPPSVQYLRLSFPWVIHYSDLVANAGLTAACRAAHECCEGGLRAITWVYAEYEDSHEELAQDLECDMARAILKEFDEDGYGILQFDDERWWAHRE